MTTMNTTKQKLLTTMDREFARALKDLSAIRAAQAKAIRNR
jgi:hypothetical protein